MAIRIRYLTIDGRNVLDPATLGDLDFPGAPDISKANSIHNPRGPYPGSAWILVDRATVDALEQTRNDAHTFRWHDYEEGKSPAYTEFRGYYLIQSQAIDQDGDEKAAYLVELQDKRCLLWRTPAVDKAYNVVRPVPIGIDPGISTNEQDLLGVSTYNQFDPLSDNLASQIPASMATGTLAGSGTGDNRAIWNLQRWANEGICVWQALCELHGTHACQPVYIPQPNNTQYAAGTYIAFTSGTATSQTGFESHGKVISAPYLLYEAKPKLNYRATWPEKIECCFPKLTPTFNGKTQYISTPSSTIDGALVGTRLRLFIPKLAIDYPVGTIHNQTDCNTAATAMATRWQNLINTSWKPGHLVYSGIQGYFTCGEQVSAILYRDYGDEDGCVTEIFQGPSPMLTIPPYTIEPQRVWYGKASSLINRDTTGTVRYWYGSTVNSGLADSGTDVTGVYAAWRKIQSGRFCRVEWDNERWVITHIFGGSLGGSTGGTSDGSMETMSGTYATDSGRIANNFQELVDLV